MDERIAEIIASLARIEEQNAEQNRKLERLEKAIFGNGKPGLTTRVQILEREQSPSNEELKAMVQALQDRNREGDRRHSAIIAWVAIFVSVLSAIMQFFQKST